MVDGAAAVTAAPARARPLRRSRAARPVFVVSGHGWGHGIGMSQYGAYGYAQHGWDYRRILAHYYPGTTLGAAPGRDGPRAARVREPRALTVGADRAAARRRREGQGAARCRPGATRWPPRSKVKLARRKKAKALPGPLVVHAGRGRRSSSTARLPRPVQIAVVGGAAPGRERPRLERTSRASSRARCRRRGRPRRSRRRPSPRARTRSRTSNGGAVRPLRRHAQPGVRRHRAPSGRATNAAVDATAGAGRPLRRRGRARRSSLDLRRPHGRDPGRVAEGGAAAVPRLRARPVRHALAVPQLGPDARDAGGARPQALHVPGGRVVDAQVQAERLGARRRR